MQGLTTGLLTFLVYFVIQASIFHSVKVSRRAYVLVGLWVAGLPFYTLVYGILPEDQGIWPSSLAAPSNVVTYLNGGLFYFFLFMGYALFFYLAESSVSVRTMIELIPEADRGLTLAELTKRYRYDWMLNRRLRRMVHAGYLVEEDGWYRATARGRAAAAVLAWFKRLFRLGPGG